MKKLTILFLLTITSLLAFTQDIKRVGDEQILSSEATDSVMMDTKSFWSNDSVYFEILSAAYDTSGYWPQIYKETISFPDDSMLLEEKMIREVNLLVNHDFYLPTKKDLAKAYVAEKMRVNMLEKNLEQSRTELRRVYGIALMLSGICWTIFWIRTCFRKRKDDVKNS
jgi:hypothetical protein